MLPSLSVYTHVHPRSYTRAPPQMTVGNLLLAFHPDNLAEQINARRYFYKSGRLIQVRVCAFVVHHGVWLCCTAAPLRCGSVGWKLGSVGTVRARALLALLRTSAQLCLVALSPLVPSQCPAATHLPLHTCRYTPAATHLFLVAHGPCVRLTTA